MTFNGRNNRSCTNDIQYIQAKEARAAKSTKHEKGKDGEDPRRLREAEGPLPLLSNLTSSSSQPSSYVRFPQNPGSQSI